eukprot:TRINITY_DN1690_c0_g1_i2.p1 TRINITY_DN1690_c0_g1~~TRINITY_DN1690_c0_g1_i2.p1  ORF type:complete len:1113 (-),score=292.08 TRINITY_DN1690_c0_g1_i2:2551-5889(-)
METHVPYGFCFGMLQSASTARASVVIESTNDRLTLLSLKDSQVELSSIVVPLRSSFVHALKTLPDALYDISYGKKTRNAYVSGRQGLYVFRVNETNEDFEKIAFVPIGSGSSKMLRTNANAFVSAHASHEIVAVHSFMDNVHMIARNESGVFELWKTFSFPNESILQFKFIEEIENEDTNVKVDESIRDEENDEMAIRMMEGDVRMQRDVHRAVIVTTSTEGRSTRNVRILHFPCHLGKGDLSQESYVETMTLLKLPLKDDISASLFPIMVGCDQISMSDAEFIFFATDLSMFLVSLSPIYLVANIGIEIEDAMDEMEGQDVSIASLIRLPAHPYANGQFGNEDVIATYLVARSDGELFLVSVEYGSMDGGSRGEWRIAREHVGRSFEPSFMAPIGECSLQYVFLHNLFGEQVVYSIKQSEGGCGKREETRCEFVEEWHLQDLGPSFSMDNVISTFGETQYMACHGNGKCSMIQRSVKATILVQSEDCFEGVNGMWSFRFDYEGSGDKKEPVSLYTHLALSFVGGTRILTTGEDMEDSSDMFSIAQDIPSVHVCSIMGSSICQVHRRGVIQCFKDRTASTWNLESEDENVISAVSDGQSVLFVAVSGQPRIIMLNVSPESGKEVASIGCIPLTSEVCALDAMRIGNGVHLLVGSQDGSVYSYNCSLDSPGSVEEGASLDLTIGKDDDELFDSLQSICIVPSHGSFKNVLCGLRNGASFSLEVEFDEDGNSIDISIADQRTLGTYPVNYCLLKRNGADGSPSIIGLSDSLWMWEAIPWDNQKMVCSYVETGGILMRDCVTFSCEDVPESIAFISDDGHLGVMTMEAPKRFSVKEVINDQLLPPRRVITSKISPFTFIANRGSDQSKLVVLVGEKIQLEILIEGVISVIEECVGENDHDIWLMIGASKEALHHIEFIQIKWNEDCIKSSIRRFSSSICAMPRCIKSMDRMMFAWCCGRDVSVSKIDTSTASSVKQASIKLQNDVEDISLMQSQKKYPILCVVDRYRGMEMISLENIEGSLTLVPLQSFPCSSLMHRCLSLSDSMVACLDKLGSFSIFFYHTESGTIRMQHQVYLGPSSMVACKVLTMQDRLGFLIASLTGTSFESLLSMAFLFH